MGPRSDCVVGQALFFGAENDARVFFAEETIFVLVTVRVSIYR